MKNKLAMAALAALMTTTLALASVQPARADQAASTRNTIIGIGAFIAGALIAANVSSKNAAANTVVGNTRDGATVYEDGHVVDRNGYSYYPGNDGQTVSCNNGYCTIDGNGNTYAGNQYNGNQYNANGYNANGYNASGYNASGYNANGYNGNGRGRQHARH